MIYTINKDIFPQFETPQIEGSTSQQVFYYSPKWNFYYTCKQLTKLLPNDKAIIVAHDWLELGMISNLGLQNPVVQFVHGDYDYYYQLAKAHSDSIDGFITVAENIKIKLVKQSPDRERDIHYLRFPVPGGNERVEVPGRCNIIFIGRLTEDKGYQLFPEIALQLREKNVNAEWHIVGEDCHNLKDKIFWDKNISVKHYGNVENDKVRILLSQMDFIILPSSAEGMPVSLIEAMKSGVIPIVNDIAGGIQELVIDNETGFKISLNDPSSYVKKIIELVKNGNNTNQMRMNCVEKANTLFNPHNNTLEIEKLIIQASAIKKEKLPFKTYGSRLDQKWIPNYMVSIIRKFK